MGYNLGLSSGLFLPFNSKEDWKIDSAVTSKKLFYPVDI